MMNNYDKFNISEVKFTKNFNYYKGTNKKIKQTLIIIDIKYDKSKFKDVKFSKYLRFDKENKSILLIL